MMMSTCSKRKGNLREVWILSYRYAQIIYWHGQHSEVNTNANRLSYCLCIINWSCSYPDWWLVHVLWHTTSAKQTYSGIIWQELNLAIWQTACERNSTMYNAKPTPCVCTLMRYIRTCTSIKLLVHKLMFTFKSHDAIRRNDLSLLQGGGAFCITITI